MTKYMEIHRNLDIGDPYDRECDYAERLEARVVALEGSNEALIEVERRLREFSPEIVKWLIASDAPKAIIEGYKWAIYGSAVHAQVFIVKPPANPEF